MAELCRKCFIEIWRPSKYEIDHIVMSKSNDMCESCMNWGPYVDYIGTDDEVIKNEQTDFDSALRDSGIG